MPKVTHRDNRGDDELPYGFIYFNDGRRVVYVGNTVQDGTGGWESITPTHQKNAQEFLDKELS